jgi:ferredoxin-type protein NapH
MKIRKLQITRHTIQILALIVILAVPAVARYANYLAARELTESLEDWDGTLQGETLGVMDVFFRTLPGGEKERVGTLVRDRTQVLSYAQQLRGGPWSLEIGPFSLTDPLAGVESVVARKKVVWVLIIGLLIPIGIALIFGRVFCSWICPMNLFLECTDKLRGVLGFLELPPKDIQFSRHTRFALLGTGLVVVGITSIPILGYIYPPAMIGREAHDLVFGIFDRAEDGFFGFWMGGLTSVSLILVAIALFEVTLSQRWWCRYMCPGGGLYALLGWVRPVRVKLDKSTCTECTKCIPACPVGLNPMQNELGLNCDNCGVCISVCAPKSLSYGVGLPQRSETAAVTEQETSS